MASTDKPWNADPYAARKPHPAYAAASDHTGTATEAAETHRRGSDRGPERPQTRSEYIDRVLAQIKAAAK